MSHRDGQVVSGWAIIRSVDGWKPLTHPVVTVESRLDGGTFALAQQGSERWNGTDPHQCFSGINT